MGHCDADTPKPRLRDGGDHRHSRGRAHKTAPSPDSMEPNVSRSGLGVKAETRLTTLTSDLQSLSRGPANWKVKTRSAFEGLFIQGQVDPMT